MRTGAASAASTGGVPGARRLNDAGKTGIGTAVQSPRIAMPSDSPDLPIDAASHEVIELEQSVPLDSGFDVTFGDTLPPRLQDPFVRQVHTGARRIYRMHDVTLDVSLMLLLRGRSRITETRYLVTDDEYAATLVKPLPLALVDPTRHFLVACNRGAENYYHWMIQSLPAIDLSLRRRPHPKSTLILRPLQPWQEDTLSLLGWQDVPRQMLRMTDTYFVSSAEYCDFLGGEAPQSVSRAAMETYRRLSEAVPRPRGTAQEIYVARTDAANRVMENEAELISLLERQGVRIIVPGQLSFAQQVAAFRGARLVIGAHGAGMSNVVFCERGACVYELLPRHYLNPVFNRLAQAAELNYWVDMFDSHPSEGRLHALTWRVDLDVVLARLDAIRAQIAPAQRVESAMGFLKRTQAAHPHEPPKPVRTGGVFSWLGRLFRRG
jgi:hypothetical protein